MRNAVRMLLLDGAGPGPISGLDDDARAWVFCTRARGGRPNQATQTAINNFVVGAKAAGTPSLWSKIDALWPLACPTQPCGMTPLKFLTMPVSVGGATHTPGVGFTFPTSNPASGYLRTLWTPSIHGSAYTLNSAHAMAWPLANVANSSMYDLGCTGSTASHMLRINSRRVAGTDDVSAGMNNTSGSLGASFDSTGMLIGTRRLNTGAGAVATIKLGLPLATASTTATGLPNSELFLGANNNNGVVQGLGNERGLALASVGGGLTDDDGAAFYALASTLLSELAAAAPT
jgi:hypothetical protein